MIRKKICMLGATMVGKTSLVRQYVDTMFDDKYQQTIGVKIDKKTLAVDTEEVRLMLWDIQGEDDSGTTRDAYLRGMDGYLLVVDNTRRETLQAASSIHNRVRQSMGDLPHVLIANKCDLTEDSQILDSDMHTLSDKALALIRTSARTGSHVESSFELLARALCGPRGVSAGS